MRNSGRPGAQPHACCDLGGLNDGALLNPFRALKPTPTLIPSNAVP